MAANINNSLNKILKDSLDIHLKGLHQAQPSQPNLPHDTFGSFLNNQVQDFLQHAFTVEKKVKAYALGDESIEHVAPLVSELSLEVEAKTKIVDALTNILKTLTSLQM